MWRAGGVHPKLWHVRRETDKNVGSPVYCLVSGWNKNGGGVPSPGKPSLWGGGCLRSTPRQGKPVTWGRGARKGVARTGNVCRTCRVGEQEPTSLRGIAKQKRFF
jgi:hypothetical protein